MVTAADTTGTCSAKVGTAGSRIAASITACGEVPGCAAGLTALKAVPVRRGGTGRVPGGPGPPRRRCAPPAAVGGRADRGHILGDASRPRNGRRAPALARVMVGLGAVATVGANFAYGAAYGTVGAIISAWPAVAFLGSAEVLIKIICGPRGASDAVPETGPVRILAAETTARPDETAAGEMDLAARRALRQGAVAAALAAAEHSVALTPDPAQRGARLLRTAELARHRPRRHRPPADGAGAVAPAARRGPHPAGVATAVSRSPGGRCGPSRRLTRWGRPRGRGAGAPRAARCR